MAIYDLDAILEAEAQTVEESEIDNESVLDGMLEACESMMESIICIDEGARQKYIDMLGDKQAKIARRIKEVEANKSAVTSDAAIDKCDRELKELRAQYDGLADKASRYSAKVGSYTKMTDRYDGYDDHGAGHGFGAKQDREASYHDTNCNARRADENTSEYDDARNIRKAVKATKSDKDFNKKSADYGEYNRYNTRSYRHPLQDHEAGAKANFNKDFGLDKQKEDKLANKKPGSVLAAQEKKRAIKETCLTILSVIDDI